MKRALIVITTLVVLSGLAIIIVPSFVDWNSYKSQVQQQVKNLTGLDSELNGNIQFSLLPSPRILIEQVKVKAPEKAHYEAPLSFERLDVNVDLIPLLSGDIKVNYVTLIKPLVNIELTEEGKINFLTSELERLVNGDSTPKTQAVNSNLTSSNLPSISLDKIGIKDGQIAIYDNKKKQENTIRNINAELKAVSLAGPFYADGSLFFDGKSYEYQIETEKLDQNDNSLKEKISLTIQPGDLNLSYQGIAILKDQFSLQGQLALQAKSLGNSLSEIGMHGPDLPLEIKGILTADNTAIEYRDFNIELGSDQFKGSFGAKLEPLKFALQIKSPEKFEIAKLFPELSAFRMAQFDIKLEGDLDKLNIHESQVSLDKTQLKISGEYKGTSLSGKPELKVVLATPMLDYEVLQKKIPQAQSGKNSSSNTAEAKGTLPFELVLQASIDKLKYNDSMLSEVSINLSLVENMLKIKTISAKNFAKSDFILNGRIDQLSELAGIELNLSINSQDVKALAATFKVDEQSLPQKLNKAVIKSKITGNSENINVTTNVSALNGELIAQGKIASPLKEPLISDLIVQVKHQNMAQAISILTQSEANDDYFKKPMDFYAKISQEGKIYNLSDIKADLAGISVLGNAKIDMSKDKPFVQGDVKLGKIVIKSSMTSKASNNRSTEAGAKDRWSKTPFSGQGLHAFDADLVLSAAHIDYGPWPLVSPEIKTSLKDGVLTIENLKAGLFEGNISLTGSIKSSNEPRQPVHIQSVASLENVSLSKLVIALAGSELIKASGIVSTNIDMTTSGISPAALILDLAGKGTVNGSNIILEGFDVARFARALSDESKPGDSLLGLWKGATKGGTTNFETLDGNFVINEGIVTIEKMDLDGQKAQIATTGNINLPNWTLSTKHKITLKPTEDVPSDVPPFEMAFSGSLDNPAQTFGQGLLNDYLNRKISRKFENILKDQLDLPGQDNKNSPQEVVPSGGDGDQNNTQQEIGKEPEPEEEQEKEPKDLKDLKPEDVMKDVLKGILQ